MAGADQPDVLAGHVPARDADGVASTDGPAAESGIWRVVARAQQGDSLAFAEIYDQYVDAVYRYLHYRTGDRTLAEDFTSETFVRALRRLDSLSFQGRDPGAWLMTIARNIVLDHVKSSRYRKEIVTAEVDETRRVVAGPEDTVVSRLDSQRLLRHVRELGHEQRECIVLRFLQDMSVSETAQVMGKNDGAVKALQHRALRRLAGLLRDER